MSLLAPDVTALTALPKLDPTATALGNSVTVLLSGAGFDAQVDRPVPGAWFATSEGAHFRVARAEERVPALTPERVSDAVALLDVIDPALVRIEGALGLSMEAVDLAMTTPANCVGFALQAPDITLQLAIPIGDPRATQSGARQCRCACGV